ncbi:hypothetical protein KKE78_01605 [Patescibacteria group bacterium]|nr:hypothetical protein [Patescibacteria group bacterium]
MDRKAQFYKTYANLPLGARNEIIVVIDGEPLTWHSAKVEIDSDTDKVVEILDKLKQVGILK